MQTQTPASSPSSSPATRKRPYRALTLSALIIATLIGSSIPAAAGPDDGKIITTRSHIDAPQTSWVDGKFLLQNKSRPQAGREGPYRADESIIWLGKGWSSRSGASQYTFTVNDSPRQSFLGQPGDLLYMAPGLPEGNNDPAWVGYGSDLEIPVEKFRDGTFALDLLQVRGPGEVEMFRHHESWGPHALTRMLSSKTPGLHSARLTPGSHTHNETTFTTAGRYELVYRAVARGLDGEVIQSEPTTMVWQVGGKAPTPGNGLATGVDTRTRYEQAPVGNLAEARYTLSIQAPKNPSQQGDEKLTQIEFTAENKNLEGTLTLYNNGYFLTDLKVTAGQTSWLELLGDTPGQLQAVFTPEKNYNQEGRWISPPLNYSPRAEQQVTSAQGEGDWPLERPDPDNVQMPSQIYSPTSGDFTVTVESAAEEGYKVVRVEAEDPNFRGFLGGGFKQSGRPHYDTVFEGHFVNGVAEYYFEDDSFLRGLELVTQVIPHPDMNARTSSLTVTDSYQEGPEQVYRGTGRFELVEDTGVPALPEEPEATAPGPTPTPTPSPDPTQCRLPEQAERLLLSAGHLDIKAKFHDGELLATVQDDTGSLVPRPVERSFDEIALAVGDNARKQRSGHLLDARYDFLGEQGSSFYGLPQTQQPDIIWPGWNTQELDYSQLEGPVKLHLEPKNLPDGGRYVIYQDSAFGEANLLADSASNDGLIEIGFATHAHANWIFTAPGSYEFNVYYTAETKDGRQLASSPQSLLYLVGDEAIQGCSGASLDPGEDRVQQKPHATWAPSPSPEGGGQEEVSRAGGGPSKTAIAQPVEKQESSDNSLASTGASVLGISAAGILALVAGALTLRRRKC